MSDVTRLLYRLLRPLIRQRPPYCTPARPPRAKQGCPRSSDRSAYSSTMPSLIPGKSKGEVWTTVKVRGRFHHDTYDVGASQTGSDPIARLTEQVAALNTQQSEASDSQTAQGFSSCEFVSSSGVRSPAFPVRPTSAGPLTYRYEPTVDITANAKGYKAHLNPKSELGKKDRIVALRDDGPCGEDPSLPQNTVWISVTMSNSGSDKELDGTSSLRSDSSSRSSRFRLSRTW